MFAPRRRLRRLPLAVAAALALVMLLGAAAPAFAASATYSQWRVALWPEYDDQRTLVVLEPQVDPSQPLPFTFSYADFPVDAQVGMTCQVTPSGSHECQQRQTSVAGDRETITYTAPGQRQLYMEYYTDMLGGQRPQQRKMTYEFVAPADIADLQVSIKQPKDATDFSVTPKAVSQQTDSDGFVIDTFGMQNVKKGQKYAFAFSYSRPTWNPPVAKTQNAGSGQGANPIAAGTTGQQSSGSQSSQTFALVAVAAFLGAGMMLLMRRKPQAAAPAPAPVKKTAAKKPAAKKQSSAHAAAKPAEAPKKASTTSAKRAKPRPKPEPEA